MAAVARSVTETRPPLLVLHPHDITAQDWRTVPRCLGVECTELWRHADFVHSLVRYRPGSRTSRHPHFAASHHLWVVSGSAAVAGRYVACTGREYGHVL